jgi:hypothetical protein
VGTPERLKSTPGAPFAQDDSIFVMRIMTAFYVMRIMTAFYVMRIMTAFYVMRISNSGH